MDKDSRFGFRHRHNEDGTWDSICLECFHTVETAMCEEELRAAERSHDCRELMLDRMTHPDADAQKGPASDSPEGESRSGEGARRSTQ